MISIIVPIYKIEKYINECIESILSQTYKDIEVILVDDGSPDNCPSICDEYANKDSRVKVIHKKNGGLMSARQAGLRAATGEYVTFVDGDDWIEPDMYEKFAEKIEKYHPDMLLCEFIFAYSDRDEKSSQNLSKDYFTKPEMETEIFPYMLFKDRFYNFGINPCCWSKVFKKELLEKNLYTVTPKIRIGEDAAFTYPCLLDANDVAYISDYLYHYRINEQSMTKSYDNNMEDSILIPYRILKDKFSDYDYGLKEQLNYYLLYLVNFAFRNEANPENIKTRSEIKNTLRRFILNNDIINACKYIDKSILPRHTKLLVIAITKKNLWLMYKYITILKLFV